MKAERSARLGTGITAWVLSFVYLWFLPLVPIAVTAWPRIGSGTPTTTATMSSSWIFKAAGSGRKGRGIIY